ncbi:hypothetical protein [Lactobacillus helveticus] [Lactiplantibacillus mudanjiangensis]|nr:hypothetical protein [Lactobacillus helveticus] [Lactiplantibacillus mudanjiangensis]
MATDNIISALKSCYHAGWEIVIPIDATDDEVSAVSNFVEAQGENICFLNGTDISKFAPLASNNRTAGWSLPQDDENGNVLAASVVGRVGSLTVGGYDWANLTGLADVTPQDRLGFQQGQMTPYSQANVNTYYYAEGTPLTSGGKMLGGQFIDILQGVDWIVKHGRKALVEARAKNPKLPFDAIGINVLRSALEGVCSTASENGIAAMDDTTNKTTAKVSALSRDNLSATDVKNRLYNGLSIEYTPASSIDGGTVQIIMDL